MYSLFKNEKNKIPKRVNASICTHENIVYIFGGNASTNINTNSYNDYYNDLWCIQGIDLYILLFIS